MSSKVNQYSSTFDLFNLFSQDYIVDYNYPMNGSADGLLVILKKTNREKLTELSIRLYPRLNVLHKFYYFRCTEHRNREFIVSMCTK